MANPICSTHATERTKHRRLKQRGSHDRDLIHRILNEGLICHVGFTGPEGPFVIPMAYARDGDRLILHGSVGSRLLRALGEGVEACVTVTLLDGLVLARSLMHHSMNYRSVMAFGRARPIKDAAEKRRALNALTEQLIPGRAGDARGASDEELAGTAVLEFPLEEASAKVRTGPPSDEEEDLSLPVWAGVIPLRLVPGEPIPAPDLASQIPVPEYASSYCRLPDEG